MDDASLVEATLQGDQSAFTELARRYRDAAFGIAFHKLGDFEAARDAAQEALVTAYVELAMLREPSKFGNWLYRITTMAALAHLRRKRVVVSLDDVQLSEPETNPAESLERNEKAGQVRDALASLPEPEQLAVILHYVNGYSHEEIGGMLGASTSAVKSRIHRARGRLKEELRNMVRQSLRESVLEQLHLKPMRYSLSWERFAPPYSDMLQINVTHVFGLANTVAPSENYLVCGEYRLVGKEEISLRLAAFGTSTGYEAFLKPGNGRFDLYAHVQEAEPGMEHVLTILMPDDKSQIRIQLLG